MIAELWAEQIIENETTYDKVPPKLKEQVGKILIDKGYKSLAGLTLDEVKAQKVAEMNDIQQETIQNGIDVTLFDGTVEHFTLADHDQTSLMGLKSQVDAGKEQIPWHTSDEAEHCKFYTNADMALITAAAMAYVTWHVTYFRDLRIYIRSLDSKEAVEAVTYGMEIPEVYRSEPLQSMIAEQKS